VLDIFSPFIWTVPPLGTDTQEEETQEPFPSFPLVAWSLLFYFGSSSDSVTLGIGVSS